MTNEERDLIAQFVARVGGATGGVFTRSVPATQPSLPAIDPEADRFIAEQFQTHPEARYRITQMAVVQEAALAEAANRIQRLQAELEAAHQAAQTATPQSGQSGGFFSNLFGGGAQAARPAPGPSVWNQGPAPRGAPQYPQYGAASAAVPPPQYPPNMQPGMFGQSGSGFLGSALRTAAGVAGGVVAGNVLMDMFSGHGGGGLFGGGGMGGAYGMPAPVEETTINNYGDAGQASNDPGWDNNVQGDPGGLDNGGGWDDNSGGGGFDSGGGGFDGGGGGFDDNSI